MPTAHPHTLRGPERRDYVASITGGAILLAG